MTGFGAMPNYRFAADWPGLMNAEKWVAQTCRDLAVPDDAAYAVQVCFEELASNVVRHATDKAVEGSPGAATWIRLSLGADGKSVTLKVEDDGPAFDPTLKRSGTEPADKFQVGGLGLGLIHSMSSAMDYGRPGGINTTTVSVPMRADEPA